MLRRPALVGLTALLCASLSACAGATSTTTGSAARTSPTAAAASSAAPTPSRTSTPAATASPTASSPSAVPSASSTGAATRTPSRYISSVRTSDPVVFLTIDDGVYPDQDLLAYMKRNHLPITVFLTSWVAKGERLTYFQELARNGAVIENHTVHHPDLTKVSAAKRTAEICGASDKYEKVFGHRPTLMRPPYGKQDAAVLAAAKGCGIRTVVGWNVVQDVTGPLQSDHGKGRLKPGDIIIFHFQPGLNARIQKVLSIIRAQHLRVALLEDYL